MFLSSNQLKIVSIIFMNRSADRLKGFQKPTVWSIMTPLAIQTNSANLGQGFPSWQPPQFFLQSLANNIRTGSHQYARAYGSIDLVKAISNYNKRYQNINPLTDILVTNGGVQALFCAFLGYVNKDDEVILFDPSYDCYRAQIQIAGGKSIAVPLIPKFYQSKEELKNRQQGPYVSTQKDDWAIDYEKLKKSLNQRTKAILINSPHNPSGKVFSQEELEKIAQILKEYPKVVVIEDSVYEGLTFDDYEQKQLPKMSFIQSMKNRTISVYSAGKIFAATGVRIGWAIGPTHLIKPLMCVHQYNVFSSYDPLQSAVAHSLQLINHNSYMKEYVDKLLFNRKLLIQQLLQSKYEFNFWIPKGGYFIMADISKIEVEQKYYWDEKTSEKRSKDMAFCVKMALEDRVVAIPCSTFYDAADIKLGENMIRFAFCKQDTLILEAGKRISGKQASKL